MNVRPAMAMEQFQTVQVLLVLRNVWIAMEEP